jgi:hypothetical protein
VRDIHMPSTKSATILAANQEFYSLSGSHILANKSVRRQPSWVLSAVGRGQ